MDMMFEQIGHVYNKKERWRIEIAQQELDAMKEESREYTQFIKN